jgi:hypothetical protein
MLAHPHFLPITGEIASDSGTHPVGQHQTLLLKNRSSIDQDTEVRVGEPLERRPLSDIGNGSRTLAQP